MKQSNSSTSVEKTAELLSSLSYTGAGLVDSATWAGGLSLLTQVKCLKAFVDLDQKAGPGITSLPQTTHFDFRVIAILSQSVGSEDNYFNHYLPSLKIIRGEVMNHGVTMLDDQM